jgi:glycerophosphoryl diester phosphodiesterase
MKMPDQIIDKRTVAIPGPVGDVTLAALAAKQAAEEARDEVQMYAGQSHDKLDDGVSSLLTDETSKTVGVVTSRQDSMQIVRGSSAYLPMLVSHRCGTGYPEQSIAGARWSVAHGFCPECDVHLLDDGSLVLCHDDTTQRTMSGPTKNVADIKTLAEWKTYALKPALLGGYTEPAPTLEELLHVCANQGVPNVECKTYTLNCMDAICDMLDRHNCRNSVIVTCFDRALCKRAAQRGYVTMWNVNTPSGIDWQSVADDGIAWVAPGNLGATDPSHINAAHAAGIRIDLFATSYADYNNAIAKGADGITSNFIDHVSGRVCGNGNLFGGGVARFRKPKTSTNTDALGFSFVGDHLSYNSTNNSLSGYDQVVPYQAENIVLDESANQQSVTIMLSGFAGELANPDRNLHIFGLCLYNSGNPDQSWIDPITGIYPGTFIYLFLRHNGLLELHMAVNGGTTQKITPIQAISSTPNSLNVNFTLEATFHEARVMIRMSCNGETFTQSIDYPVALSTDPLALSILTNQSATGIVLSAHIRRDDTGEAKRW